MAAKLLHSLTDDNPDLQKQIGCMTGVFQLFDRQHIIPGRRIAGHSPKRLPPGTSQFSNGMPERESSNIYQRSQTVEKHANKNVQDNHRVSTESSRESFSSLSRSSSFSSVDYNINRTAHPEPEPIVFPETPSREPMIRQSGAFPQIGRQSLDLRDVVKDSMYREARGLSHRSTKDEEPHHVVNYRESLNALAKLREGNWYGDEPRELSRSKSYQFKDGSSFSLSKDCPRFSYDGRETNRLSFESRESVKTTNPKQLKELPRLSLDSRESSMRSLNSVSLPNKASDTKSNLLPRNSKSDTASVDESPVQSRPTGVVAKLMGLDSLPDSASATDNKMGVGPIRTHPVDNLGPLARSSKAADFFGPIKMPNSPRSSLREPTSPCWKNPDMKPISRFPIEPAPWKHRDGARSPQKPTSRVMKSPTRTHSPFSSVYSEVEKRLKHLEFTQSGKDLRALKQILEAMQSMEARKGGRQDLMERYTIATQNARISDQGKPQGDHQNHSFGNRGSNSSRAYESPIVIMKPAKLVEKSAIGSSSVIQVDGFSGDNRKVPTHSKAVKDQTPKAARRENAVNVTDVKAGGRQSRTAQTSTKQQHLTKESTTSSVKSLGSVSPRLQQKRLELERRSRPPTPPTDSSKPRKQSNKQQSESSSPGGRRRPKYSNTQQSDDQFSEISSESRTLSSRETQMSQELISDIDSKMDTEVTAPAFSEETDSRQSPSSIQEKSTLPLREDESLAPEYPSPVSVLDEAVYMDNSPSPVKHMLKILKDDATQNLNEKFDRDQWEVADAILSNTISSGVTSEINRKKLQSIEHLVQKLRRLNSSHDETHTDYIASLCENAKPDHRYISEILLASGLLLRDLGSSLTTFQFHSSGHPINPELFLVLEQTKFSNLPREESKPEKLLKREKFHRKLIFDTVNEILAAKLALVVPSLESLSRRPFKLVKKTLNAQKLLRDLCLEIEELQVHKERESCSLEEEDDGLKSILWEDVFNRSESWIACDDEIPVIALEVERLIFKDLVNEVVLGEAADGRRAKPGRRGRQLFSK